jgi:predicted phage tail protein
MFFLPLLLGMALSIVAYMIMPKPKKAKPEAAKDMDSPTAEAGRPIPVLFGTMTIKGLNILWYGDKTKYEYQVRA